MRILLIKMSSMGDVFHTFPALSDAQAALPELTVDWVVEESFADIAAWHPVVDKVYPIRLRQWRKSVFSSKTRAEIKAFFDGINQTQYDLVLDAQGLLKSAWVAKKAAQKKAISRAGYDWSSIREPLASLFYQQKHAVSKNLHAIERIRRLFSGALDYALPPYAPIVYGLDTATWRKPTVLPELFQSEAYGVFLHGTTWESKYWPEENWIALLARVNASGQRVVLLWGNEEERLRALRIAKTAPKGMSWVPEQPLSLNTVAQLLAFAQHVISVDTGLSHVAAALEVPMVVLYRVTDPKLVGADGENVVRLASPCAPDYLKQFPNKETEERSLEGLSVNDVWGALMSLKEPMI